MEAGNSTPVPSPWPTSDSYALVIDFRYVVKSFLLGGRGQLHRICPNIDGTWCSVERGRARRKADSEHLRSAPRTWRARRWTILLAKRPTQRERRHGVSPFAKPPVAASARNWLLPKHRCRSSCARSRALSGLALNTGGGPGRGRPGSPTARRRTCGRVRTAVDSATRDLATSCRCPSQWRRRQAGLGSACSTYDVAGS